MKVDLGLSLITVGASTQKREVVRKLLKGFENFILAKAFSYSSSLTVERNVPYTFRTLAI